MSLRILNGHSSQASRLARARTPSRVCETTEASARPISVAAPQSMNCFTSNNTPRCAWKHSPVPRFRTSYSRMWVGRDQRRRSPRCQCLTRPWELSVRCWTVHTPSFRPFQGRCRDPDHPVWSWVHGSRFLAPCRDLQRYEMAHRMVFRTAAKSGDDLST